MDTEFLITARGNFYDFSLYSYKYSHYIRLVSFFFSLIEEGCIPQSQKRKFNEDLNLLSKYAKTNGLSVDFQEAVIDVALNLDLGESSSLSSFSNVFSYLISKTLL